MFAIVQILSALFFFLYLNTGTVSTVTLQQLQAKTQIANDTLYIANFWATWCKPCVEEMPYFEAANQKFGTQKVKLIFVSLNAVKEKAAVEKFAAKNKIAAEVVLLDAGNPNVWINQLEPEWTGSIPATLFYKNGKKVLFHEGELNQTQLDSIIQLKIKQL